MKSYLDSLTKFRLLKCKRYLPAHGPISENYAQRIDQLIEHHLENIAKIEAVLQEPKTLFELIPVLFDKNLPTHQMSFALGEAASHIKYMCEQGSVAMVEESPAVYARKESLNDRSELKAAIEA